MHHFRIKYRTNENMCFKTTSQIEKCICYNMSFDLTRRAAGRSAKIIQM